MHNSSFKLHLAISLTCLLLLTPALTLLHAQVIGHGLATPPDSTAQGGLSFQKPTPDELSMTSDPKAPAADAVYLNYNEIDDDLSHNRSIYARIKVLTEKGKELASVSIPYLRKESTIYEIKGRTIHSDGTIINLDVKPADLLEFKSGGQQVNQKTFSLPSVEVGSILEYKIVISYKDNFVNPPDWFVQQPYFIHSAHFKFVQDNNTYDYIHNSRGDALNRLMYTQFLGNGASVQVDLRNNYLLDIADIPAIKKEDWAPPMDMVRWHVYFYYTYAFTGDDFWHTEGGHWMKEVDSFAKLSKPIHAISASLITPGDTEEQTSRKLYDAVMKLDNTEFSRHKSNAERKADDTRDAKTAEDLWLQKSGSPNELALLYLALLRSAGIKAWPMIVADRTRYIFDSGYLNVDQLQDVIVIANINGKDIYLDPGSRFCAFGEMHWTHYATRGLRINPDYKGTSIASTPNTDYSRAAIQRMASINLNADGSVTGMGRFFITGPEALRWRQLTLTSDTDEVTRQFNEELRNTMPDGLQVTLDHFEALENYNDKLTAFINFKGVLGTKSDKRYFLPGLLFESQHKHPFIAQPARFAPIDAKYARITQDAVVYHLPTGYSVESAPLSAETDWSPHAALIIKSTTDASTVSIARTFMYNYTYLPSTAYADLHDYYLKVAAADQQQLVLTRTSATTAPGGK